MGDFKLADGEYRFAELVWESEPVNSTELARLAAEKLGWKKSTSYTVLRKLCQRGILQNDNATVTALVKQEEIRRQESEELLKKSFRNSLPVFLNSFLQGKTLTRQEVDELQRLIDEARERSRQREEAVG